jgi:hypothetical protein
MLKIGEFVMGGGIKKFGFDDEWVGYWGWLSFGIVLDVWYNHYCW